MALGLLRSRQRSASQSGRCLSTAIDRDYFCAFHACRARSSSHIQPDDLNRRGELFLSTTRHRNFTSTLTRDARFARFFFSRLRRTTPDEAALAPAPAYSRWISPCMGERNWVALERGATPVVFVSLSDDATRLRWAGGAKDTPFDPAGLRVHVDTGALLHPSPILAAGEEDRFGRYSLIRSQLVIDALSDGLELDADRGGRYRWRDEWQNIAPLESGDAHIGE
jgi:hypothetical protein